MLEPIVQDYLEAAMKLGCAAFCQQLGGPVLVQAVPEAGQFRQAAPTRMLSDQERLAPTSRQAKLDHRAEVRELRPAKPNRHAKVTIGRSEDNDLVLTDETVSSQHAMILKDPKTAKPSLQDKESTNGSRINDRLVVPWRFTPLTDGDVVSFGDSVFLFYTPAGLFEVLQSMFDQQA
jgi:hypothetical protein